MLNSMRCSCDWPRRAAARARTATVVLCAIAVWRAPASALQAAAAKIDITPDLGSENVLLAGFGSTGRKPSGVHDPLHARLLLLREGTTTAALVGLDLIGWAINDTQDLRRLSGYDRPGRSLFISATHTHSGPDTLGLWGALPGLSGVDGGYHARVKRKITEALNRLEGQLRTVTAEGGRGRLDPSGLCRDSRDPQVIDPGLAVLRFKGKNGRAVSTVVNWSCHPEVLGPENRLLTADYPGALCARVEARTGGACLFLGGMIGGLLTPDTTAETFAEAERIGTTVADAALALPPAASSSEGLSYRSERILVPVENSRYRLALPSLTFGHRLFDAKGRPLPDWKKWSLALRHLLVGLTERTEPWVESEVSLLRVGPALILGLPGEVFPELALGGYDGRASFGRPLLTPGNPDPPDVSRAPEAPYLLDLVQAQVPILAGLANDELGYIVPAYDFKTRGSKLMLPRMPGHHYEETNSIGPSVTRILIESAKKLLQNANDRPR